MYYKYILYTVHNIYLDKIIILNIKLKKREKSV